METSASSEIASFSGRTVRFQQIDGSQTYIFPDCSPSEEEESRTGKERIRRIVIYKRINDMYIWGDNVLGKGGQASRVSPKICNHQN